MVQRGVTTVTSRSVCSGLEDDIAMKVIKPQRLGLLQRVVEHERRCTLVVSVLVYVPLTSPRKLLTEMSLWNELAEELPGGVLDEGLPKPCGEVLVTGRAFAPGDEPVGAVMTRVKLGPIDKKLAVVGDRYWKNGSPSDPAPFAEMPIDWAHAFGGEGYPQNPIGKGFVEIEIEHGRVLPLPNVEEPDELVAARGDRPPPAGYGPYDLMWPQRYDKVGKRYDDKWLKTLFPGPAEDFDAHFFNTAPSDQQIEGFFAGDEGFELEGMHPDEPRIEGQLEKLVVRGFATQRHGAEERFEALSTRLDTVHLFPHLQRAVMIYRGTLPVAYDDADDVVHLMVAAEDPAHPKTIDHYRQVLARRLDKDRGALASLDDRDLMPPEAEGWSARMDVGDMGEMMKLEHRGLQNMERGRDKRLAEGREILRTAGFDPDEHAGELPELGPLPDPHDFDALSSYLDKLETEGEKLAADAQAKKEQLEREARESFEQAGLDYDAEMRKAGEQAAGAPMFCADDHLLMLHEMAHLARDGGEPLEELERDLTDPRYEEMLQALEAKVREAYARSAHFMPAAAAIGDEERQMLRVQVVAAKDGGVSLARRSLTRADLSGLDLSGMDLSGALLEGADLSDADLSDADLSGAVLAHADLTGALLAGADLSGANLGAARLVNADLSGAVLVETVLTRAVLDGTVLVGTTLQQVDFLETDIGSVDLSHARAEESLFVKVDLRNVGFAGARLRGASFIESNVEGVDFTGCELGGAHFIQCAGDEACFAGAALDGAVFVHESSFARCCFVDARLAGANFRKTALTGGDFRAAVLDEADLSACDLSGADLHRAQARGAMLVRTEIQGANLRGANLLGAMLSKARLAGADLTGANLSRADLSRAQVDSNTRVGAALMLDTRVDPKDQTEPRGAQP